MFRVLFVSFFFFINQAHASEIDSATIKRLMIDRDFGEKVFIELDRHQLSPEQCHTNTSWEYVLDISDQLGKAMYSSLLALYASGKPGEFHGTETCMLYSTIEDLERVEMK